MAGAAAVAATVVVGAAALWSSLSPAGPDAQLLVREEAGRGAAQPLDGRQIRQPAEVLIGTGGDIDSVSYRLVAESGATRFAGTAWTAPFTLAAAAGQDDDPLGASGLPPGAYLLTATIGFADGGRGEASAGFTIVARSAVRSEPAETQAPADEADGVTEPEEPTGATAASGRPGPESTGPRVPTDELEPSGGLVVTENGAVVERLDIAGTLVIEADDVVVRDTRVSSSAPFPVRAMPGTSGTVIEYVEVDGQFSLANNGCIDGARMTVRNSELHRCTDGAKLGSGSVYEANWIHDPTRDNSGSGSDGHGHHVDGLQSTGGEGIIIRGNLIDVVADDGYLSNAAIILKSDLRAISDCLIEGNWLNGGNFTIFLREGKHGPPSGCVVRDNRFGRDFQYGTLSIDGDVALSSNVWDDDGSPVSP